MGHRPECSEALPPRRRDPWRRPVTRNVTAHPGTPLTPEDLERLVQELVAKLMARHEPGKDRLIVPENVYQPANAEGRDEFEAFQLKLLLPGSGVVGLEHLDHCLGELRQGRSVIFLPEHRGNLDVTSFNALLRREDPRYHEILDRLIYIAGRKLNESSELIKMFTERYSRLVIVPRRELPPPPPGRRPRRRSNARKASARPAASTGRRSARCCA